MDYSYLAFGGNTWEEPQVEMINSLRVLRNVEAWNAAVLSTGSDEDCINWLGDCDACLGMERFYNIHEHPGDGFNSRPGYTGVQGLSNAPWYDPSFPDSLRFLGVLGLELEGADGSVRTASVLDRVGGGAHVSRQRATGRELLVRALLVGADQAGLAVGLNWLRCQTDTVSDDPLYACDGNTLWLMDVCPPKAIESDYDQDRNPPTTVPDITPVARPYVRAFHNVRVIEGPVVTKYTPLPSGGWLAEVEMLLLAGDPHPYGERFNVLNHRFTANGTVPTKPPPIATSLQNTVYEYTIIPNNDITSLQVRIMNGTQTWDGVIIPSLRTGEKVVVSNAYRRVMWDDGSGLVAAGVAGDINGAPLHLARDTPRHDANTRVSVQWTGGGAVDVNIDAFFKGCY